jgi:hypothetical protein
VPPPAATTHAGPLTHIYTFIPATRELLDFNSETGKTDRRTVNIGVFSDSAWCLVPGNALVITGGSLGAEKDHMQKSTEFTLLTNQTRGLSNMNDGRSHHGLIFSRGYVYALGGNNIYGVGQAKFERLDLSRDTWERLPNLTRPVVRCSVAESVDGLYFTDFGSRVVHTYNTATQSFSRLNFQMPERVEKSIVSIGSNRIVAMLRDGY